MELRRATESDWVAARDIRLRSLEQNPDAFCSSTARELAFDDGIWRDRVAGSMNLLAWDGDRAIGTVTGKDDRHEPGGRELVAMWVDPAHRGKGVSDALIFALVEWARADGAPEVALWVAENNEPARALYERCGFSLTGQRDVMRQGVDQVRMRLQLPQRQSRPHPLETAHQNPRHRWLHWCPASGPH